MEPIDHAQQAMQLTPQERMLYARHLSNLNGTGKVVQPNGSVSTLYQMSVTGPDHKIYNIPSIYDGKMVTPQEAIQRAEREGWQYFPSYPDAKTAEARYQQMHGYMEQDLTRPRQFSGR